MAWKISRTNDATGVTQVANPNYNSGEGAFRNAMANAVDYVTAHWDGGTGADEEGPADDKRFKIYVERRIGGAEVELRYDYKNGAENLTNSIYWRILEV